MKDGELIAALRNLAVETGSLKCLGCGHEHNCSTRGCAILNEAADRMELINKQEFVVNVEIAVPEVETQGQPFDEEFIDRLKAALLASRDITSDSCSKG